ncbi:MarR family transcriptional regulator [Halorubrum sp. CBA1125]|uniref:GbsR/MarR family transcriptional regulator n=1 Tax=Halorubrum sp. CBA1125 TaxID=2668072 RepID=UPI0012E7612F|nr:MarR family transcriptional regulator [Halorubrum sp. CBA1125]MUW15003.1 MarR family transcriptional regulator [Halorubrum sp. CBA1125]
MRDDDPAAARERVIESMEQSAELYGLSRSAGRIYGVLYFAAEPLSIGDLVEETGYAKSTVSNVTRTLTRIGLIRRRSSSGGGRRVRFEPERELWYVVREVLRRDVARELQTTLRTVRQAERDLEAVDDETAARIRELRETHETLLDVVDLAADFSAAELREALEAYDR